MNIEIKDTIILSDNSRYIVVSKTNYKSNIYYYLIDENNHENIKYCIKHNNDNSLSEIFDKSLIQELLPFFLKSMSGAITKEDLELMETVVSEE